MTRVLKWRVPLDDQPHPIGAGRVVLVAQQQYGVASEMQVWTVETYGGGTRYVQVFGTGHTVPDDWEPVGSCVSVDGQFVWHVFERMAAA
ncbi:MAG: hypothetical protein M3P18_09795 [Actinomycetota bacterium]|nr:hypothetical protein [Actinomycetota bacterium]